MKKFAVVTGASTGIGQAIAIEFAKQGYSVGLVGRSEEKLIVTQKMIEDVNGSSQVLIADLSDIESVNSLIKKVIDFTDQVDVLINVAGIWHGKEEVYAGKDFETFSQKVILDTYSVGLLAPTLLAHAFIPLMKNGGKILNISGTFENGAKGWLPYFVSKKAIEDLTVGLSQELEDKNIQVNAISPSDTATEAYAQFFPQYMDDAIEPKEIANYAFELCDHESKVTGKVFVMKKGQSPKEGYHN